jgi:hypothetical protein
MPMMAAVAAGDFMAEADGFKAAGSAGRPADEGRESAAFHFHMAVTLSNYSRPSKQPARSGGIHREWSLR